MKSRKFHAERLGVREDAAPDEIREAFLRKSVQGHYGNRDKEFLDLMESCENLLANARDRTKETQAPLRERTKDNIAPPKERTKDTLAPGVKAKLQESGHDIDKAGGLLILFAGLSFGKRALLVLIGLATAAMTTAVVIFALRSESGSRTSPENADTPNVIIDRPSEPQIIELNCSLYPYRDGKIEQMPQRTRKASRSGCADLCEKWLGMLEANGADCFWGTEIFANKAPDRHLDVTNQGARAVIPKGGMSAPGYDTGPGGLGSDEPRKPTSVTVLSPPTPEKSAALESVQEQLLKAVMEGDIPEAKEALKNGADIDMPSKKSRGHTSLQMAMLQEKKDMFIWLIDRSAKVNQPDTEGLTPLMLAATHHIEMDYVRALAYPGGADLDLKNKDGRTAAELADDIGYNELATYLRSKECDGDVTRARAERKNGPKTSN